MTKYAKRLDKSRPFGEYHPPDDGRFFDQDGYGFDHDGNVVEKHLTDEQKAALAKKPKAAAPQKQPNGGTAGTGNAAGGEGKEEGAAPNDGLNLESWLRGEEDYAFPDVQKAVKERYSVWKTAKRDLLLFLVEDQHLVEADALSDEFKAVVG